MIDSHHSRWALPTQTLLQIVLFAGLFLLHFFQGTDVDVWWHLSTGRYILDTGTIPQADPFSYTAAGQPWVAHEWLADLLMYLLFQASGYVGMVVFFASVTTLAYWILSRTLLRLGVGIVAACGITFWAAITSMAGWHVRPQAFSYLFFSLFLYLLIRSRQGLDRRLWLAPVVMIPWVNLHAGYVTGLLLLGFFMGGEGINRWLQKRPLLSPHLLLVAAATVAATVANPQGIGMLLYPFSYAGTQNASMKYITEWQSPNFHDYFFFLFGASLMVLMVTSSRRPADWALGIPLLVLTAMSLQSVRVIPFYAIVAAPFIGMKLTRPAQAHSTRHATPWNWPVLALCLLTLASTLFLSERTQLSPSPRMDDFPTAGVQYIRDQGLTGRLFNTYHWGGYLIWSFYPEQRVFVDGRPDMYGDAFIEEYRELHDARPGWKQVLDRHQIEVALVEKNGRVATLLSTSREWEKRFEGEIEAVFVRLSH